MWESWEAGWGDMRNAVAAMPGIAMAAVVGVPHPRWDERPVAVAGILVRLTQWMDSLL